MKPYVIVFAMAQLGLICAGLLVAGRAPLNYLSTGLFGVAADLTIVLLVIAIFWPGRKS